MSETYLELRENQQKSCFKNVIYLLSMPFLLFMLIVIGYIGWVPFKVEGHSVFMIGIIFIIYLFFLKHNAFYATCKFLQEKSSFIKNLDSYIENNILEIGQKRKANASYSDFVEEYTSKLRDENFSSVAAGMFPMLGILGTFISIAISMPDFSSQTSAVLEKEISLLLGGVGTAFYASIYGIFLSIWWVLFDRNGLSRFEKEISIIKERTKIHFWSKEEIKQTYFQKSMQNYEKLNQVFHNFAQDNLIESMNKTLLQRVEVFEQIMIHEQKAIQNSNRLLSENIKITSLVQDTNEQITQEFKKMILQFNEASLKIEQIAASLSSISNSLSVKDENLERITDSLSKLSSQNIENIHEAIVKNFEVMKKDTEHIGWILNSHLNEFDEKFHNRLKDTILSIDSEVVKIVNSLQQLKDLD